MAYNKFSKIIFFTFLFLLLSGTAGNSAFALVLTATENISISANVGSPSSASTSGSLAIPQTAVRFSGEAYPNATVTVLKRGVKQTSVLADSQGLFSVTLPESYDSTVLYTLFATDTGGQKSLLINYPIVVYSGYLTHLSGIRFAPIILTDKIEVRAGDYLTVFGSSLPGIDIDAVVEGQDNQIRQSFVLTSDKTGSYKIIIPTADFSKGDYVIYVKYVNDTRISKLVKFTIGETNIPSAEVTENIPGDCNADNVINLVDFSVLAFWYGKNNPPVCVDTNRDKKIDLIDFSILAFWWTG